MMLSELIKSLELIEGEHGDMRVVLAAGGVLDAVGPMLLGQFEGGLEEGDDGKRMIIYGKNSTRNAM